MAQRKRRLTVVEADASEVEQFAASLKQSWLLCRELGHTWKPRTARYIKNQRVYERTLVCSRCTTERLQLLDGSGHVVSSQYRHPDGYLHKGLGRISGEGRDVLRLESLQRFISAAKSA